MLCTVYYNVMFTCTCTLARSHPEGKKTLGETWAAIIKAINSILWTSMAARYTLARMGAELSSLYAQKGTMKDVLARCLKKPMFNYIHYLVYMYYSVMQHSCSCYIRTFYDQQSLSSFLYMLCTVCVITGVYFSPVKNKPWIPWVYTWFWNRREQLYCSGYSSGASRLHISPF